MATIWAVSIRKRTLKTAFWKSDLLDYKPFETWEDEGARDTQTLASLRVEKMLNDYQQPAMDPAIKEALDAFVANAKRPSPTALCDQPKLRAVADCPQSPRFSDNCNQNVDVPCTRYSGVVLCALFLQLGLNIDQSA